MNDPERLHHDGDDFERSLLRSAHRDGPSHEGKNRAILALGLGASVAASTATGAASAAAAAAPTTAGLVAKWMLVGALLGGGVLVTSETLAPSPEPAAVRAVVSAPVALDRAAVAPPQAPATAASAAPATTEPAPAARPRAPDQRPALPATAATELAPEPAASAQPTATALPHDPLTGELLQLDAARSAMAQGKFDTVRVALDQYSARFPQGKLSTEAQIMRIELTWRQGDRQAATSAGQAFLAAHPASPHAPRLRALLGLAP